MSTDDEVKRDPSDLPEGENGLFSQLPRTRPGRRSPRRAGDEAAAARQARATSPDAPEPALLRAQRAAEEALQAAGYDPLEPPSAPDSPPRGEQAPPRAGPAPPPDEDAHGRSLGPASLEDLAWAGVAVTAEAATLGVRLLGRAVDAAKRATDRG